MISRTVRDESILIATLLLAMVIGIVWLMYNEHTTHKARTQRLDSMWSNAVVVKICRDGTRIWKLNDGRLVTGGLGSSPVASVDVCDAK